MNNKMVNVFEGIVNGRKFDNRDEMNKYIGELITTGTPITELAFSNTTRTAKPNECPNCTGRKSIEEAQNKHSWTKYMHEINSKVPEPYTNVINYVVPFIREDITIDGNNWGSIFTDLRQKLTQRMNFMETNIFQAIKTGEFDTLQVKAWMDELCTKLKYKGDWCLKRVNELAVFLNSIPDTENDIIKDHIDMVYLNGMHELYQETAGFCTALIDIINEKVGDLK